MEAKIEIKDGSRSINVTLSGVKIQEVVRYIRDYDRRAVDAFFDAFHLSGMHPYYRQED
jgi:hypothetical protein